MKDETINKLSSSVTYPLVIFPIIFLLLPTLLSYERTFGFGYTGIFGQFRVGMLEAAVIAFVISIPICLLANFVMGFIENLKSPHITDHFRQSFFHYLIIMLGGLLLFAPGVTSCQTDCHGLILIYGPMIVSFYAIIINAIFLLTVHYWKKSPSRASEIRPMSETNRDERVLETSG